MHFARRITRGLGKFYRGWNNVITVGNFGRTLTPYVQFKDLRRGDILSFRLSSSTTLSVKVLDTATQLVLPCQWHFMRGPMQIRGVAIAVGHPTRFGHPRNEAVYIDLGPAWQLLLNGEPIGFPLKAR